MDCSGDWFMVGDLLVGGLGRVLVGRFGEWVERLIEYVDWVYVVWFGGYGGDCCVVGVYGGGFVDG